MGHVELERLVQDILAKEWQIILTMGEIKGLLAEGKA